MTLFELPPLPDVEELSADRRRTLVQHAQIEAGIHPATRLPIRVDGTRCGDCTHAHRYGHHRRAYWKCDLHRLGVSHSAASDIRVSWPACERYEAR